MNPPITDYLALGRQLRCPEGTLAQEIGDYLFVSNRNMIEKTIDTLALAQDDHVLEIGFGNGKHLPYLFCKAKDIHYTGVELSAEMIRQAKANNNVFIRQKRAVFLKENTKEALSFLPSSFHAYFSVNTYYFINDLKCHFQQVYSYLIQGGKLCLGYIDKAFGERMPFTKEGFTFYSHKELEDMLLSVGFTNFRVHSFTEDIAGRGNRNITRPFYVAMANK